MSNAKKLKKIAGRQRKTLREERQARKVFNTIIGVIVVLFLAILIWVCYGMG